MTFFEQGDPGSGFGPPRPRSRRRGIRGIRGSTVVMLVGLGLLAAVVVPMMLGNLERTEPRAFFEGTASVEELMPVEELAPAPPLAGEVAELADRMFLTDEGRELFARTEPQLVDADQIGEKCADATHDQPEDWSVRGCFILGPDNPTPGRIFVYRSGDERLMDAMVTVAAHELLHAVYANEPAAERTRIEALMTVETARVPTDDPVHAQIAASAGDDELSAPTEQFAYLGSQSALEGGFDPALEKIYADVFIDRAALVDTHQRSLVVVDNALDAVRAARAEVAAQEQANAQMRAQLEADRAAYETSVAVYEKDRAKFDATPPEERKRWKATLTPAEGNPVTMSWQESLTYRFEELERFRVDMESRASKLRQAEASAAALRTDAETLKADAVALMRAASPGISIPDF